MQESIRRSDAEDVYGRTHRAFNDLTIQFQEGPVSEHASRAQTSREQAGLEIRSMVQSFVEGVRSELPDRITISGRFSPVDLNLDRWTFYFIGAQTEVDSARFGEFWFEHRGAIVSALEERLLASRGVFLG